MATTNSGDPVANSVTNNIMLSITMATTNCDYPEANIL